MRRTSHAFISNHKRLLKALQITVSTSLQSCVGIYMGKSRCFIRLNLKEIYLPLDLWNTCSFELVHDSMTVSFEIHHFHSLRMLVIFKRSFVKNSKGLSLAYGVIFMRCFQCYSSLTF